MLLLLRNTHKYLFGWLSIRYLQGFPPLDWGLVLRYGKRALPNIDEQVLRVLLACTMYKDR